MPSNRFLLNKGPLANFDHPYNHLIDSLTYIVDSTFPNGDIQLSGTEIIGRCGKFGGLYKGPTSVACLFITLSRYYPELTIRSASLMEWAKRFLESVPTASFTSYKWTNANCGVHNEMFVHAIFSGIVNRDIRVVDQICSPVVIEELLKEGPEEDGGGVDEWLYGRAGFLYLLRILKFWFVTVGIGVGGTPLESIKSVIDDTSRKVVDRVLLTPRPWIIWGTPYIGAVHGAIGIITQIILTIPSYATKLEGELSELLTLQLESGNWPTQFGRDAFSSSSDKLVQFCHGAPGFVISLAGIRKHLSNNALLDKLDFSVARGRECIWTRGLLTKDPNLCHGIAGNALAFLTEDDTNNARFAHFASFLKKANVEDGFRKGVFTESDSPLSLLCGEAGRAWVWAVADRKLGGKCIGYNDV